MSCRALRKKRNLVNKVEIWGSKLLDISLSRAAEVRGCAGVLSGKIRVGQKKIKFGVLNHWSSV